MRIPLLLAVASGMATALAGYTDAYFPQNDVFSYYQIFHYSYSSILLNEQIPLWLPYSSYGLTSAFEMAFTFGPSKALAAFLGWLLQIRDVKALFFGAVGVDFALMGLAAAYLVRDMTGRTGPHVALAAILMPLAHNWETQPNFSYGFALAMLFTVLFLLRSLQTRRGVYLMAAGLALVSNVYGNPQYLVVPEVYLGSLFLLLAGLRYRRLFAAEWKSVVRSFLTLPCLAIAALAGVLASGILLIDHEVLRTLLFVPRLRNPDTLHQSLHDFLYYLWWPAPFRIFDILVGRPLSTADVWLYFGASSFTVLLFAFIRGWRIPFMPELLILTFITTIFSLPALPLAKWVYYLLPGMDLYRPVAYACVFAKPFAILATAVMISDRQLVEAHGRLLLFLMAAIVTIGACLMMFPRAPAVIYWDSTIYRWIAIGGALALTLILCLLGAERWKRFAPLAIALVLAGEVVVHRVAFETVFYSSLAELRTKASPAGADVIENWYKWPRPLAYQPIRVVAPQWAAPFEPFGSLYHGLWSFLGVDPCQPHTRSDSYPRWVGEALERRGATPAQLGEGQLRGIGDGRIPDQEHWLGRDVDVAFGCGQPKLTIDDPNGTTRMIRFTANEVHVEVASADGGFLTYRDAWAPGWLGTLDGGPVQISRNEDGFKVLRLPPGKHLVKFMFRPTFGEVDVCVVGILLAASLVAQGWLAFASATAGDPGKVGELKVQRP